MSHLVPTPRTDKNGVTSIRHMLAGMPDASRGRNIPPVAPLPLTTEDSFRTAILATEMLTEQENFYIPIPDIAEFSSGIERVCGLVPNGRKTLEKLLSTGSERARFACALELMNGVKSLRAGEGSQGYVSYLDVKLLGIWHGENVAEEAGRAGEIDYAKTPQVLILDPRMMRSFGDDLWRGLGIMRLAFEAKNVELPKFGSSLEFMKWAGNQDPSKINAIIEFARERSTADPEALDALINAPESDSALRDGIL